jgi:hypothetical protein
MDNDDDRQDKERLRNFNYHIRELLLRSGSGQFVEIPLHSWRKWRGSFSDPISYCIICTGPDSDDPGILSWQGIQGSMVSYMKKIKGKFRWVGGNHCGITGCFIQTLIYSQLRSYEEHNPR